MATWKTPNGHGNYFNTDAKQLLTNYILRPDKLLHNYWGGINIDLDSPAESMVAISEKFRKTNGVQIRHFIVSFAPNELRDPFIANEIARQMAEYTGQWYQTLYAVHENKPNLHFHLIHNSVSFLDGSRYYGTREEHNALGNTLESILKRYHINTLVYVKS